MPITLSAHQPFSFHAVVNSHGWVQLTPFRFDEERGVLSYIIQLESGRAAELCIQASQDGVLVEANGMLNAAEQAEAAHKVTWMLGLEEDFSTFYAVSKREPRLAHVEAKAQGRVLRSATLFEDVIKTILTTNTLWAATKRMTNNLVERFGTPLQEDPVRRAFPTPESLASTTEMVLRSEMRLGYRAPYILAVAQAVAAGDVDLEALKTSNLPTLELRKRLLALKGVGPYAAANLLLILGRGDYLPIDTWAMKLVSEEWYGGEPVGPKEVTAAFEDWGEWKGLAYWFWDWAYLHKDE
jgi:3-methyladenine DNA glycosylase/8-oxoguanine DNA glycosylase